MAYKTIQTQTLTVAKTDSINRGFVKHFVDFIAKRARPQWRNSRRSSPAGSSTARRSRTSAGCATPTGAWRMASSKLLRGRRQRKRVHVNLSEARTLPLFKPLFGAAFSLRLTTTDLVGHRRGEVSGAGDLIVL